MAQLKNGDEEDVVAWLNSQLQQALSSLLRAEKDSERLDWLNAEHTIVNPVAALVVKRFHDRTSSEWANVSGNVRAAIDAAMSSGETSEKPAITHKSYCATTVTGAEGIATCTCGAVTDEPHDGP